MAYRGTIIKESLTDTAVLDNVRVLSKRVIRTTPEDGTPNLKQWTLYSVEIPDDEADTIATALSGSLDSSDTNGHWYADFKSSEKHFIVFPDKIFEIDRSSRAQYQKVVTYGLSIGIPAHQLDFSPDIE